MEAAGSYPKPDDYELARCRSDEGPISPYKM